MAPTVVQFKVIPASVSGSVYASGSFSTATTAGNCIVVEIMGYGSAAPAISGVTLGGAAGNFSAAVTAATGPVSATYAIAATWIDYNCAGGQTAVVVSGSNFSNNPNQGIIIYEVAGLGTGNPVDKTSAGISAVAGTNWSSGSTATSSAASEIWFGCASSPSWGLVQPGTPWVNQVISANYGAGAGYQITSATGNAAYAGTQSSGGWAACVVTLSSSSSSVINASDSGSGTDTVVSTGHPFIVQTAVLPAGTAFGGSFASPTKAGNTVVVVIDGFSGTSGVPAVTGVTLGGSADHFSAATAVVNTYVSGYAMALSAIWVDYNCAGGQTAIAIISSNLTLSSNFGIIIYEVGGMGVTNPVDKTSTGQVSGAGGTGAWSSGSTATTASPDEVWFGADIVGSGAGTQPGAPWVNSQFGSTQTGGGFLIPSATGAAAYAGTQTGTSVWTAAVVTLLGAAVTVSGSDSGLGTESGVLSSQQIFGTDTGAGTDSVTGMTMAGVSDTGAGTDTAGIRISGADSGLGTDAIATIAVYVFAQDSGIGSDDLVTISQVVYGAADTGTGTEATTSPVNITGAVDYGAGTDTWYNTTATIPGADSGLGTDTSHTGGNAMTGDSGLGTDLASMSATPSAADTGAGTDSGQANLLIYGADSGAGTENARTPAVLHMSASFSWHVLGRKTRSFSFTWNTLIKNIQSAASGWNTLHRNYQAAASGWHTLSRGTKGFSLTWNVGSTATTRHSITASFSWNTASSLTTRNHQAATMTWNVSSRVSVAVVASWDVLRRSVWPSIVPSQFRSGWAVLYKKNQAVSCGWHTLGRNYKTAACGWKTGARVQKPPVVSTWNTLQRITDPLFIYLKPFPSPSGFLLVPTSTWNIAPRQHQSFSFSWYTLVRVEAPFFSVAESFPIPGGFAMIPGVWTSTWQVLTGTPVSVAWAFSWNTLARIELPFTGTKELQIPGGQFIAVPGYTISTWNVSGTNKVSAAWSFSWNTLARTELTSFNNVQPSAAVEASFSGLSQVGYTWCIGVDSNPDGQTWATMDFLIEQQGLESYNGNVRANHSVLEFWVNDAVGNTFEVCILSVGGVNPYNESGYDTSGVESMLIPTLATTQWWKWAEPTSSPYWGGGFVSTNPEVVPGWFQFPVPSVQQLGYSITGGNIVLTYNGVEYGYIPMSSWPGGFGPVAHLGAWGEVFNQAPGGYPMPSMNGAISNYSSSTGSHLTQIFETGNLGNDNPAPYRIPGVIVIGDVTANAISGTGFSFSGGQSPSSPLSTWNVLVRG